MICLSLWLASCSTSAKVESNSCPQPAPSLLLPAPPLSEPGQAPVREQGPLLAQYAEDVGAYNALREKHADLAGWVMRYCLAATPTK